MLGGVTASNTEILQAAAMENSFSLILCISFSVCVSLFCVGREPEVNRGELHPTITTQ